VLEWVKARASVPASELELVTVQASVPDLE
jgi:hypothetical protein